MVNRFLMCCIVLLLFSQQCLSASNRLRDFAIWNPLAMDIATKGVIKDLNTVSGGNDARVHVKLIGIPKEGDCDPKTRMVCSYDYYLGVMEKGRDPGQTLFYMGEHGEVTETTWVQVKKIGGAELKFRIANYPQKVLKRNPSLKSEMFDYKVQIVCDPCGEDKRINRYSLNVVLVEQAKQDDAKKKAATPKKKKDKKDKKKKNESTSTSRTANKKPAKKAKPKKRKRNTPPRRRKPASPRKRDPAPAPSAPPGNSGGPTFGGSNRAPTPVIDRSSPARRTDNPG